MRIIAVCVLFVGMSLNGMCGNLEKDLVKTLNDVRKALKTNNFKKFKALTLPPSNPKAPKLTPELFKKVSAMMLEWYTDPATAEVLKSESKKNKALIIFDTKNKKLPANRVSLVGYLFEKKNGKWKLSPNSNCMGLLLTGKKDRKAEIIEMMNKLPQSKL